MDEFLEQIEHACSSRQFYLALMAGLALPDMCGAMSFADGQAKNTRFIEWFDQYVANKYAGNFSGKQCYAFRCSTLHQGRSMHPSLGYERVLFIDPAYSAVLVMHNNVMGNVLNLDIQIFCADVIASVRQWMDAESANPIVQANLATFLKRYKGGFPPLVAGPDVYS